MIDHVGMHVKDFGKSKAFFEKSLKPLGYALVSSYEAACGFGPKGKPAFWLTAGKSQTKASHVAFMAPTRKAVDEFYQAALAAGAKDNGKPGVRADYHPTYYAAFVIDPDGNNVEAVCHTA